MKGKKLKLYQQGLTIVEMAVTIAVAAIVIMIVVPSFSNLIESSKSRTTRDLLVSSIHKAKEQAQTKRVDVYMCPTSDGSTCSGSTTWGSDWLLFEDSDGSSTLNSGDVIISNITTKTSKVVSSNAAILFSATGHTTANSFDVCDNTDSSVAYQVVLSRMGRITYATASGVCP